MEVCVCAKESCWWVLRRFRYTLSPYSVSTSGVRKFVQRPLYIANLPRPSDTKETSQQTSISHPEVGTFPPPHLFSSWIRQIKCGLICKENFSNFFNRPLSNPLTKLHSFLLMMNTETRLLPRRALPIPQLPSGAPLYCSNRSLAQ